MRPHAEKIAVQRIDHEIQEESHFQLHDGHLMKG
jgi:hypothetical protein